MLYSIVSAALCLPMLVLAAPISYPNISSLDHPIHPLTRNHTGATAVPKVAIPLSDKLLPPQIVGEHLEHPTPTAMTQPVLPRRHGPLEKSIVNNGSNAPSPEIYTKIVQPPRNYVPDQTPPPIVAASCDHEGAINTGCPGHEDAAAAVVAREVEFNPAPVINSSWVSTHCHGSASSTIPICAGYKGSGTGSIVARLDALNGTVPRNLNPSTPAPIVPHKLNTIDPIVPHELDVTTEEQQLPRTTLAARSTATAAPETKHAEQPIKEKEGWSEEAVRAYMWKACNRPGVVNSHYPDHPHPLPKELVSPEDEYRGIARRQLVPSTIEKKKEEKKEAEDVPTPTVNSVSIARRIAVLPDAAGPFETDRPPRLMCIPCAGCGGNICWLLQDTVNRRSPPNDKLPSAAPKGVDSTQEGHSKLIAHADLKIAASTSTAPEIHWWPEDSCQGKLCSPGETNCCSPENDVPLYAAPKGEDGKKEGDGKLVARADPTPQAFRATPKEAALKAVSGFSHFGDLAGAGGH
ncbi:uncharacterized protein BDZ99DRAFT_567117 [Mytilinidion resinicola]|uniref:Uncharacterized protein n=1 Tax=Mytilinidion resinicola TaxID=574789 RepID=A0A6A6Z273_9PEZI|nr:uncharacterized protein BDZ99DRAFT_567117 [Mytilinidion resinicola]KAF2815236.1 hypothetical protein BDZ99DRAFT_567117 [Mytilinidion resinicola]